MPKYLIRRTVPGIAAMAPDELHDMSAASNTALTQVPGVQWVQSYITDDELYCVYNASDEGKVREHARVGGFPCDDVRQVVGIIDPVTGEG